MPGQALQSRWRLVIHIMRPEGACAYLLNVILEQENATIRPDSQKVLCHPKVFLAICAVGSYKWIHDTANRDI